MTADGWVSHPDEVEALVERWRGDERLTVDETRQYAGRPVYALTVSDPGVPADRKRAAIFHKDHAHEPAPCAAMMNVVAKLLDGRGLDREAAPIDPRAVLGGLVLTFIPDANPGGTERAPVRWWDGTRYTNDELWIWMRGLDPATGGMWERYDRWDLREVDPRPATIGIVYEQVSEHVYVEPNRSHESSLFRLLHQLLGERRYDLLLGLHQTEFVGQVEDCEVILPITAAEQPGEIVEAERRTAERVLAWWDRVGGRPMRTVAALGYDGVQAEYFRRAWGEIYATTPCLTSEVRNNSALCPPAMQRRLSEAAVWAAIEELLR